MLSAEEIDRRAPVWRALSDLFLDTELNAQDFRAIADTIKAAQFSVAEAEEILRREVAPVFGRNLLNTAGEWQPWEEEQVREMLCAHLNKRRGLFSWLADWSSGRIVKMIRPDWLQVRAFLERPDPDSEIKS